MQKLESLRKYVPLLLLGVDVLASIILYAASDFLGAPTWANLYNSISLIFLLFIIEAIFYKPEQNIPRWYSVIVDPRQFTEKFNEIKNKSHTVFMVWCAFYGDAPSLEPYFVEENALLCSRKKTIIRLVNTARIAGGGKQRNEGEELYEQHLKWMSQAASEGQYHCYKTNISEYEVAMGISFEGGHEIQRACLIINDEYNPKFMVFFDDSRGEEAKGVVRGLNKWFARELEAVSGKRQH